ncbi:sulfatase-like hydrolase/transferase [Chloroflexota bacterium]
MKTTLNRRDFLKLTTLFSMGAVFSPHSWPAAQTQTNPGQPNILIMVFDAWSASNISLYGYERKTTPNLARLADKAIVYHQHYAGGHFTTPGTASILTGSLPWKHRAFELYQQLDESFLSKNIFDVFPGHHRFAYTHNPLADFILQGLMPVIDDLLPRRSLYLESNPFLNIIFSKDFDTASVGWNRTFNRRDDGYAYSLYLSHLYEKLNQRNLVDISPNFPLGIPNRDDTDFFTLEQGIDWLSGQVKTVPQPFLGYYHFLPPHNPYKTRIDFYKTFAGDGYKPPEKPHHMLASVEPVLLKKRRTQYDEYILYVDAEFNRLYQDLEQSGLLENTWLVLTSDHGEMFERGIKGHSHPVLYQPVMRVPLMIFPPGGKNRVDVDTPTSAIDLLPTLLSISGMDIPAWAEGQVLPQISGTSLDPARQISSVQVDKVEDGAIKEAVATLVEGDYKLIWTIGYEPLTEGEQIFELYDLANDPEELENLYPARQEIVDELFAKLKPKLEELQSSYQT